MKVSARAAIVAVSLTFGTLVGHSAIAEEHASPALPNVTVGNVSSANQGPGLTAGYVGSVNQTVLPTLVRGPLLETFKHDFSVGARILRSLKGGNLGDDQIVSLCTEAAKWTNDTSEWLERAVSDYASERFLFVTPLSYVYFDGAKHSQVAETCKQNWLNYLPGALQNIDMLMREPSLYPDPSAAPPRLTGAPSARR